MTLSRPLKNTIICGHAYEKVVKRFMSNDSNSSSQEEVKGSGSDSPAPTTTVTLHIGNISYQTTEESLTEKFSNFGKVINVQIPKRPDGRSKGYAFIEVSDQSNADEMINKLDKTVFEGRTIHVDMSDPSRKKERRRDRYDDDRYSRRDRRYDDYSPPPRRRYRDDRDYRRRDRYDDYSPPPRRRYRDDRDYRRDRRYDDYSPPPRRRYRDDRDYSRSTSPERYDDSPRRRER